jgi:hypothetical protein
MKIRMLSAVVILLFSTACNGTFEVGLEHSPTATSVPISTPSNTPVAADTLTPTAPAATQPAPTVQAATETPVATEAPTKVMVQVYLIALSDNGQAGVAVGCGDSAVPIQIEVSSSHGALQAALEALLAIKDQFYGQSGLYNALYQADLQVQSARIVDGKASVFLTGTMMMGGECDIPRFQAQLEQTILGVATVTQAAIFINGKPLADALSLK